MAKLKSPFRIGIAPIDGFALMSYAALVEPLRAANVLSDQELYNVSVLQIGPTPAQSSGGDLVPRQVALGNTPPFDLVILVGAGNALDYENVRLANWLKGVSRKGTQIGGGIRRALISCP